MQKEIVVKQSLAEIKATANKNGLGRVKDSQKTMQVWGTGASKHLQRGKQYTAGLVDGKKLIELGHAVATQAEVPALKSEPAKAKEAKAE